jgi:Flp pilus assembly CpaE family ATPase
MVTSIPSLLQLLAEFFQDRLQTTYPHGLQVCGLASLKRNFLPFFFRFFKAYYRLDGG